MLPYTYFNYFSYLSLPLFLSSSIDCPFPSLPSSFSFNVFLSCSFFFFPFSCSFSFFFFSVFPLYYISFPLFFSSFFFVPFLFRSFSFSFLFSFFAFSLLSFPPFFSVSFQKRKTDIQQERKDKQHNAGGNANTDRKRKKSGILARYWLNSMDTNIRSDGKRDRRRY